MPLYFKTTTFVSMDSYELTIIVPVYNEIENLLQFQKEGENFLKQSPIDSTFLVIDDGSDDGSLELIKSICLENSKFRFVSLDRNYGLSTAIKTGIDLCSTNLVGYIDADLQVKPLDFLHFFPYLQEYNMVNGIRRNRSDGLIKKVSSKIANSFRRLVINDGIEDTCCPLKIMKTDYAKRIPFFDGMHRFIPALVQLLGGSVKQIEIDHYSRYAGTSKYHLRNRLVGPFFDTLAFYWMRHRFIKYRVIDQSSESIKIVEREDYTHFF
ncbi:MAG: glycosyltransferase [Bacteroidetes bacterium]|nr:glycosyltransferase [Bacteroidota bacterium]